MWANIRATINLLITGFLHGARYALATVSGPADRYLMGLRNLFAAAVLFPLIIALPSVWLGGYTLLGFLGVWSMVGFVFLFCCGALLGVLIDSLTADSILALPRRVAGGTLITGERYVSIARTVLLYETFSLFFLSQIHVNQNMRVFFGFTLGVFFLVFSGYEWHGKSGTWVKPFIRTAMMIIVFLQCIWFVVSSFLPKVQLLPLITGDHITSLEEVDNIKVKQIAKDIWGGLENHYDKPYFWFVIALLVLGFFFALWWVKKVTHNGESGSEGGSEHHGMPWATTLALVAFALLCLGAVVMRVAEYKEKVDRDNRTPTPQFVAQVTPAPARMPQVKTNGVAARPSNGVSTNDVWKGLLKPITYAFPYTTNWGPVIQRPPGMSVKSDPKGLRPEFRINGTNLWTPGTGRTGFPPDTRFFEIRNPKPEPPIEVVFGVGKEIKVN